MIHVVSCIACDNFVLQNKLSEFFGTC